MKEQTPQTIELLFLLPCILIVFSVFSCTKSSCNKDIYGTWRGELQGKVLLFQFKSDQTAILSFMDIASGTVEEITGNFEVDCSKKPIPLSIRNIPQLNHPLHTIIKFSEDDSIQLVNFSPRWRLRPISFIGMTSVNLKRFR